METHVSSLEVVELALFQFNLVDNQYQKNTDMLYTFNAK